MKFHAGVRILLLAAVASLGACASITGESTQMVRVDTVNGEGKNVDATCKLTNDFQTTEGKSGSSIAIHRSSKDLDIRCSAPGNEDANGRAISRANGGMAGNILFGGGIGAIIDYNKGAGLTYPTWVRMIFGQTLTFDRRDEKEGQVVVGTPSDPKAAAATPAATSTAAK